MKAKMQSVHLERMMQKHIRHPEYTLAFPSFSVKKKKLAKLKKDDILLLGLEALHFQLFQEGEACAAVALDTHAETMKIEITKVLSDDSSKREHSDKYETLICAFTTIQSRKLETGHKIEMATLKMQEVTLLAKGKAIASAKLVTVDEKIAIQITEVYHG